MKSDPGMKRPAHLLSVEELVNASFSEIIDVRSPAEFAEDHLPGAINCPVLSDEERARIGTIYKQVSPFEATKQGGVLIARNIAAHIETRFLDRPRNWRPLVYCWRGGQRSGAMTILFRQIGWNAHQLVGGYKGWRRQVVADLAALPCRFDFRVICGPTGSGKSRVLQEIGRLGGQIVDLETLACHKGSVLGALPDRPQPSQKMFESRLRLVLAALDPARPVYVEAESRKIGRLQVPEAMIETMRAGRCIGIEAPRAERVAFLLRDYAHFPGDPAWLGERLAALKTLRGGETVGRWQDYVRDGRWPELVEELLAEHYDPLYARSQQHNYDGFGDTHRIVATDNLSPAGIAAIAAAILAD